MIVIDYKIFFAEIAEWINAVNQMAMQHGMQSQVFWDWVMTSSGELSKKYNDNELVKGIILTLISWVEDTAKK